MPYLEDKPGQFGDVHAQYLTQELHLKNKQGNSVLLPKCLLKCVANSRDTWVWGGLETI